MPPASVKRTNERKEEIINACEKLYQTMSFKDITLKEIGKETSFSRTSIYNYFETKEEIFLALLKREYDLWISSLNEIIASHTSMSDEEIAAALSHTLDERRQLLKIMSMNHYDLEENSRMEMQQIALAWHWAKGVASPIIGSTKASHLEDAAGALAVKLTAEDVAYLEEPYIPHRIVGAIDHNPADGVMLLDEKR